MIISEKAIALSRAVGYNTHEVLYMAKSTDDLMKILKSERDVNHYIEENSEDMISGELREYLSELLAEKGLTIAKAARRAQMSDSYFYKINQGVKANISRDKIIQMCFGLGLNIEESRRYMRMARVGELYPKIVRDSVILFCLEKHIDIIECDKMLIEAGEKALLRE